MANAAAAVDVLLLNKSTWRLVEDEENQSDIVQSGGPRAERDRALLPIEERDRL